MEVEHPGPRGKVRPFWRGVLLTVVTLGIYPLWWHYRTHDELMTYVGRPNRAKALWFAYIALLVVMVVHLFAVILPAFRTLPDLSDQVPVYRQLARLGLLGRVAALVITAQAFAVTYFLLQHRALYRQLGRVSWITAGLWFVFLYLLAGVVHQTGFLLLQLGGFVLVMFAYALLQGAYNRFWSERALDPVAGPTRLLDRLPDGRNIVRTDTLCAACQGPLAFVGAPGTVAQQQCPACGRQAVVRLPDHLDESASSGAPPAVV